MAGTVYGGRSGQPRLDLSYQIFQAFVVPLIYINTMLALVIRGEIRFCNKGSIERLSPYPKACKGNLMGFSFARVRFALCAFEHPNPH